jgi:hypothetical protein
VSVLVVAQPSSEIPEALMNYFVYILSILCPLSLCIIVISKLTSFVSSLCIKAFATFREIVLHFGNLPNNY